MFLHLTKHVSLTTTYVITPFTMDANPPTPTNMQLLSSVVKGQISIHSGVNESAAVTGILSSSFDQLGWRHPPLTH